MRRGVKPNQAMLSATSSTTETSASELSFATNNSSSNNNNNSEEGGKHQLTGSSSNTVVEESNATRKSTLSRHRSSGCLSRNSQSTLSLSRTKSSSALNKVRSRSMNLLLFRNGDSSSSSSSDESDGLVLKRAGALESKRRSHGRPRSFSVRVASVTHDDKQADSKGKRYSFKFWDYRSQYCVGKIDHFHFDLFSPNTFSLIGPFHQSLLNILWPWII